jgi:UrcA family protein
MSKIAPGDFLSPFVRATAGRDEPKKLHAALESNHRTRSLQPFPGRLHLNHRTARELEHQIRKRRVNMSTSSTFSRSTAASGVACRVLLTAVGAAAMSLLAFGAGAKESVPQIIVQYQGIDLAQKENAANLYARLRSASRAVCEEPDNRQLRKVELYRACYAKALSDAVATVDHASVTALFNSDKSIRVAQRGMDAQRRT